MPCYQIEGRAFAQHVLATQPDARIGIVYQNDDFGRDVLKGFKDGLGAKASAIVAELSYESAIRPSTARWCAADPPAPTSS